MKVCCFTGHRPKGLPWGYDETKPECTQFKNELKIIIKNAVVNGYTHFISGMAEGFDTIALEILFELKAINPKIYIEGAIPCIGQELKWNKESQERYQENLKKLDKTTIISNHYSNTCMHERNDYMLNCSDLVIACYSGGAGGTISTISKAKKKNKKIIIINPKTLEIKGT